MPPNPKPENLSIIASIKMQQNLEFSSPWPAVFGPELHFSGTPKICIANLFCEFQPSSAESYVDVHLDIHLRPTEPQLTIPGNSIGKHNWTIWWLPENPPTSGIFQLGAAIIGGGTLVFSERDLSSIVILGIP